MGEVGKELQVKSLINFRSRDETSEVQSNVIDYSVVELYIDRRKLETNVNRVCFVQVEVINQERFRSNGPGSTKEMWSTSKI